MAISVQVLFDTPQREIAPVLRDRLNRCVSASLLSGFGTVEGIAAIGDPIRARPDKLRALVLGSGTYRAYEALDQLIGAGVPQERLHVHLGHTRPTAEGARPEFCLRAQRPNRRWSSSVGTSMKA
jgi:hypothetical protein